MMGAFVIRIGDQLESICTPFLRVLSKILIFYGDTV
jgi:hypothetical protein